MCIQTYQHRKRLNLEKLLLSNYAIYKFFREEGVSTLPLNVYILVFFRHPYKKTKALHLY